MIEGTMMLPVESLAANPGQELTGKEDDHVLNSTLSDAVTFNAAS